MKKVLYAYRGQRIGGREAVSLPVAALGDRVDKILSGEKGWIFVASDDGKTLGMVLLTSYVKRDDYFLEKVFYFDIKDLKNVIFKIQLAKGERAIHLANNPNDRHVYKGRLCTFKEIKE